MRPISLGDLVGTEHLVCCGESHLVALAWRLLNLGYFLSLWLVGASLGHLTLTFWVTFDCLALDYWMQRYTFAHFYMENHFIGTLHLVNEL